MKPRVLIVDDEALIRDSLARAFESEGWQTERAGTVQEGLAAYRSAPPEVMILDLKLPDGDGLWLLREARKISEAPRVLVITAHGTIEAAVEAMKLGAFDFVKKPFELEELLAASRNALRTLKLEQRLAYHDARARRQHEDEVVRGQAPSMSALWAEVEIVAKQPVPLVLITGESGTGKSLIARALHYGSPRADGPFVELNAASLPDTLLESELFGHERGAFSDAREAKAGLVEVADGGTLFLDEIGDLSLGSQAKLLSFLESLTFRRLGSTESRTVDVRIVAATNQPLEALVKERRFRGDLYFRLATLSLEVPALRERAADVPALAAYFVHEYAVRFRKSFTGVSDGAARVLMRWSWPGNVRELKAVIQRAVLMNDAPLLELEHLPSELLAAVTQVLPDVTAASESALPTLEEVEQRYIRAVYELCGGNKLRAAERLGITRQTLARRLGENE